MSGTSPPSRRRLLVGLSVCLLLGLAVGLSISFCLWSGQDPGTPAVGPSQGTARSNAGPAAVQSLPPAAQPSSPAYLIEPPDVLRLALAGETLAEPDRPAQQPTPSPQNLLRRVRAPTAPLSPFREVSDRSQPATRNRSVTGIYLVAPDGTINLRQYGTVHVGDKRIAEAEVALEEHLSQYFDSPEVSVEVAFCNSKVYYVVIEGSGQGDTVVRAPVQGNEMVLDAISNIGGLPGLSDKDIWIARPSSDGPGSDQILPVDWEAITRDGAMNSNYQVMPGDRIFISSPPSLLDRLQAVVRRLVE